MLTVKNCENVKFSFSKLLENEIRRYRYMCTSRDFVTDKKMKIGTSNSKWSQLLFILNYPKSSSLTLPYETTEIYVDLTAIVFWAFSAMASQGF